MQDAAATTTHENRYSAPWRASPGAQLSIERSRAHKARCRQLPPITASEAEDLVARFLAERGSVTSCPPAFAAPVR